MALRIFLDTNVVLDFLFDRKPSSEAASKVIELSESGNLILFLSAMSINNIYYIARRTVGHEKSIEIIKEILGMVEILDLNKETIVLALESGFRDFEDGLQHASAYLANDINMILTQNVKDFGRSGLPVMTPEIFLASKFQ